MAFRFNVTPSNDGPTREDFDVLEVRDSIICIRLLRDGNLDIYQRPDIPVAVVNEFLRTLGTIKLPEKEVEK